MIRRVLVALDGSPRAQGVLEAALEIAARFGATLRPVRAVFVPPEFPAAAAGSRADPLPAHLLQVARDELRDLVARSPNGSVTLEEAVVRIGKPSQIILETADLLDVDLVVVGSHGYHTLDRILGTTAGRVANLAHRNVLVVHEREERASGTQRAGSPYRV